jgi:DNA-directed RNA polymerase sigma subunit (sigma70/sigma32)
MGDNTSNELEKLVKKLDDPKKRKRICDSARFIAKALNANYKTIYEYILATRHEFKTYTEYQQFLKDNKRLRLEGTPEEKKEIEEGARAYEINKLLSEEEPEFDDNIILFSDLNDKERARLTDEYHPENEILERLDLLSMVEKLELKPREVTILKYRIIFGETLEDCGTRMGMTRQNAYRKEKRTLQKLRAQCQNTQY